VRRAEGEDPGLPDGSPDGDGSAGEPGGIDSGPGDSDGGPDASGRRIAYVDAAGGDDANDGATPANPFRTITRALGSAVSGDVVQLGPGTYDAALGEVFPLVVPEGVILRGDEARAREPASSSRDPGPRSATRSILVPDRCWPG
jgi:hypothetical protein